MTPTGFRRALAPNHDDERTGGDGRQGTQALHHPWTTLLVFEPNPRRQLTMRRNQRWVRLLAKLRASSLDRQLADGRSPESGRLLASRAQALVSPEFRAELARDLANVMAQARHPAAGRRRVPLNRRDIVACEPEIRELIKAIVLPAPTPAHGIAKVSWLLTDGTGPLFNCHCSTDLAGTLADALTQLDRLARP